MQHRYYYYIVQNDEIVGRYGPDLQGALGHLAMFGIPTDGKNCPNRAIIPVLNGNAQHPDSVMLIQCTENALHSSNFSPVRRRSDYWESHQILVAMQQLVEREHRLMMPFNHSDHMIGSVPFKGYRPDIQEACRKHFENIVLSNNLGDDRGDGILVVSRKNKRRVSSSSLSDSSSESRKKTKTRVVIENLEEIDDLSGERDQH